MLFLLLLLSPSAMAYENGTGPFCLMDNNGNTRCYYQTMTHCRDSLEISSEGSTCVKRQK